MAELSLALIGQVLPSTLFGLVTQSRQGFTYFVCPYSETFSLGKFLGGFAAIPATDPVARRLRSGDRPREKQTLQSACLINHGITSTFDPQKINKTVERARYLAMNQGIATYNADVAVRSGAIASVVVVIVPAGPPGTALVKKDRCLMGRDFKALVTGLAGYIIIYSDEVIS